MLKRSDPLYVILITSNANAYWLSTPSAGGNNSMLDMNLNGSVDSQSYSDPSIGFRPIVCLKSGITLQKVSDTQYAIQ